MVEGIEQKTAEEEVAEIVARMKGLFEGDESLTEIMATVREMKSTVDGLSDLDLAAVAEEVDKLRAGQEALVKSIRTSKRGLYVPGIEDEQFSVVRALVGVSTGRWRGAEKEREIMQEAARVKAGQVAGDDELGGYFIPDQVIPDIIGAIYTASAFVALEGAEGQTRVSVLDGLVGGTAHIPKFDGGLIAYWIGEEDAYAESTASVGDVTLTPKKMGVLVRLTDTMKRLQGYGFERLLRTDMVRAAAKKLDWTVAYGSGGDHMPRGIASMRGIKIYSAEQGVAYTRDQVEAASSPLNDWDGGDLNYDLLMNMELALEEDDIVLGPDHAWITSPRGVTWLKQLKIDHYSGQTTAQAYLIGAPYLRDDQLRGIIGEFGKSTQILSTNKPGASVRGATDSTTEKYTDVFGGNLSNVVVGRWAGIEIEDDGGKGAGFSRDHTYIKLRIYLDVQARQQRGLVICPDAQCRA